MSRQGHWELGNYSYFKPKGCPIRQIATKGPMKLCEGICNLFKLCIEITMKEVEHDEFMVVELERLRSLEQIGRTWSEV